MLPSIAMRIPRVLSWLVLLPSLGFGQLRISKEETPLRLFSGEGRFLQITLQNAGNQTVQMSLRSQIYQTSSATVLPVGQPQDWKRLEILAHQTVKESIPLDLPSVMTGTRFLVRVLDERNKAIGTTAVMVYPTNLLQALGRLAGEKPLGLFDPQDQLKPLLKAAAVEYQELEEAHLLDFSGKLAIIWTLPAKKESSEFAGKIGNLAKTGTAVVWIQAFSDDPADLEPAFYPVSVGRGTVTIVSSAVILRIGEDPRAQLILVRSAELSLRPDLLALPFSNP